MEVYAFFANTPKNASLKSEQQTAKMYKDYFNDRFENEVKFQEKMKDNSFLYIHWIKRRCIR